MKKLPLLALLVGSFFFPNLAYATNDAESFQCRNFGTLGTNLCSFNTDNSTLSISQYNFYKGTYPDTSQPFSNSPQTGSFNFSSWSVITPGNSEGYTGPFWYDFTSGGFHYLYQSDGTKRRDMTGGSGLICYSNGDGFEWYISSSTVDINDLFNSGGLSTTTTQSFCDTNLPYDDSTIIKATLTAIPNGACRTVVFLVVPTTNSLNQFNNLASTTKTRFPFSYLASIGSTWTGLTASTTANSPTLTYNLADLGIGSTSPIGNILPNIDVFSSTTVRTYIPDSIFNTLKFLAGLAILLTLIADIFFTTRNLFEKKV